MGQVPQPVSGQCWLDFSLHNSENWLTMKKIQTLLVAALVAGSHQASALIDDSKFGTPGELFISVWDEAGGKSFYKDLGISMTDFLDGKACFQGDFTADPNWAGFANAANLKFNIAAVNSLLTDRSNITKWGYLATSADGQGIFNGDWSGVDNTRQKIQGYIGDLNYPTAFAKLPGQAEENKSGVFQAAGIGYTGKPSWNQTMGRSVKGNTLGTAGRPVDFYFVNNANGQPGGAMIAKLGSWTLNAGKLTFAGAGSAPVSPACGGGGGTNNVKLTISKTGNGNVTSTPAGINCGSTCAADFPAGTKVTLTAKSDAGASFTGWGNACSGTATTCDVTLNAAANASATFSAAPANTPSINLTAPASWKVKAGQAINWTSTGLPSKAKVTLQFSKNGGAKYANLKPGLQTAGSFTWKPAASHVTTSGVLRACAKPDPKKSAQVCSNNVNIVVAK
jgi:hypothetical protein